MEKMGVAGAFQAVLVAISLVGCGGEAPMTTPTPTTDSPGAPMGESAVKSPPRQQRVPKIKFTGSALIGAARRLSVGDIESNGLVSWEVYNPYTEAKERYSGVLVREFVKQYAPTAQKLQLTAIDDYQVELTAAEWNSHEIILATRSGGKLMGVAEKGPVRIVIAHPQAEQAAMLRLKPKWIWQIVELEFEKRP